MVKMSFGAPADESVGKDHLPSDIDWEMLDKKKFFVLGCVLFTGVTGFLYPTVVIKTRQQVLVDQTACFKMASSILRNEGIRGFYRGFGIPLMGTIPARTIYMGTLEITKSNVSSLAVNLGFSEASAATIANAVGGLTASLAAQLVWTPIDVVSQRLMVQGGTDGVSIRYSSGIDGFRKIVSTDGYRGLYRGFGISALTYSPSSAIWWASYSITHRLVYRNIGGYCSGKDEEGSVFKPHSAAMVAVQGVCAAMASGVSAFMTMPLDTIKTRLQVLDGSGERPTIAHTVRDLVKDGGFRACYRGLGPRWASMSVSSITMITTYEFLKRMSIKKPETNM